MALQDLAEHFKRTGEFPYISEMDEDTQYELEDLLKEIGRDEKDLMQPLEDSGVQHRGEYFLDEDEDGVCKVWLGDIVVETLSEKAEEEVTE